MRIQSLRVGLVIAVTLATVGGIALSVQAGRSEFGFGLPVTTSFSFSSYSVAFDAYYRLLGSLLAWEIALQSNPSFSSLYLRNTLATAGAIHLCIGHITNLMPYFGSTAFTVGLGVTLGRLLVFRTAFNLAFSYSMGSFYFFPEIRFQVGVDP